jgi:SAM-dependent methyltransferase
MMFHKSAHKNQIIIFSSSGISDWLIENLESDNSSITWTSTSIAGENDTIPETGLCIGKVRIFAAGYCPSEQTTTTTPTTPTTTLPNATITTSCIETVTQHDEQQQQQQQEHVTDSLLPIKLLVGRNGWGTGVHPTTRLCLEYICSSTTLYGGEIVLDYGCGSGILSIAALHMGALKCIGVDIEVEALVTAERNIQLNGYNNNNNINDEQEYFIPYHTREVLPYSLYPGGVDICFANILIGQLVRPSMVAALTTNIRPGGIICFSGIRPNEIQSLKDAYNDSIHEWIDTDYAELKSSDCIGSIESYGYDCGIWCRLVGKIKLSSNYQDSILSMSELAVS